MNVKQYDRVVSYKTEFLQTGKQKATQYSSGYLLVLKQAIFTYCALSQTGKHLFVSCVLLILRPIIH